MSARAYDALSQQLQARNAHYAFICLSKYSSGTTECICGRRRSCSCFLQLPTTFPGLTQAFPSLTSGELQGVGMAGLWRGHG